jgi:hypothetical protein
MFIHNDKPESSEKIEKLIDRGIRYRDMIMPLNAFVTVLISSSIIFSEPASIQMLYKAESPSHRNKLLMVRP